MKRITLLLFGLFFLSAQAQNKADLLNTITNQVCECLEESSPEELHNNSKQAVADCFQSSFSKNVDNAVVVYGEAAITSHEVGKEVKLEVIEKLKNECNYYAENVENTSSGQMNNGTYTAEQLALLDHLSDFACNCSSQEVENDPNHDLQQALNNCLLKAILDHKKELLDAFGDEFITSDVIGNNVGVEIGNRLITTCELFTANNKKVTEAANSTQVNNSETGVISHFVKKGDFISLTLINTHGVSIDFIVNQGFENTLGFVESIKELKKNQSEITIYYYEDEIYFKTEDVKRIVNVISDVKF